MTLSQDFNGEMKIIFFLMKYDFDDIANFRYEYLQVV